MKFIYLSVETSSDKHLTEEIKQQANKTLRISGYVRDIIWRNKNMREESKIRLHKACTKPVLIYANETRAETSKTKRMMKTIEMKILRTVKGVILKDRVRSDTIRQELNIQDVVRWTKTRRRFWRDYVDRMDPERIAK